MLRLGTRPVLVCDAIPQEEERERERGGGVTV
jgi:hypothetical protein